MKLFYTLQPGETLEREIKTALVVWLPECALAVVLILLPFFFLFRLFGEGTIGVALFFVVLCAGLWIGLRSWIRFTRTRFIITSQRVIALRQSGFFEHTSREIPFYAIESIAVRTKGFFQTIFRYGTLKIETKGQSGRLVISNLSRPSRVQEFLYSFLPERSSL